jgi:hypothetical protein
MKTKPKDTSPDEEFFNVEVLRQSWNENAAIVSELPPPPEPLPPSWEDQLIAQVEKARDTLPSAFPAYRETTELLLTDLENTLRVWLGPIELGSSKNNEQPPEDPKEAVPEEVLENPTLAFLERAEELEDYLEAIFVDGNFWRLNH